MYLFYNKDGLVTLIHYKGLPEELADKSYMYYDGNIPYKPNHHTVIKVINGEVKFTFRPLNPLEEKVKELQETVDILLGGEEFD